MLSFLPSIAIARPRCSRALCVAALGRGRHLLPPPRARKTAGCSTRVDNMSQGLCMFDAQSPHRPGQSPLHRDVQAVARDREPGLLAARIDPAPQGHRAVHRRCRRLLPKASSTACAQGKHDGIYVQASDGRIVLAKNHPLPGGGWVSTHEDVTEQRRAEEERAAIHDQEQRRARSSTPPSPHSARWRRRCSAA